MSVFTNPAGRAPEQAAQYVAAILGLLGDRRPLDVLSQTTVALRQIVAEVPANEIIQPEAAGKWSIREVLQHLADSELVWGYRLRMTLAQDRPPLTGYDQDEWASRLRYRDADPKRALEQFAVLRESNLALLRAATDADLERVAVHAERGEESIAHMMRLYAGHDLLHLAQIARIRRAVAPR